MWDPEELRREQAYAWYVQQQNRYMLYDLPSVWNPFIGKPAEYLLYGRRRLRHYV